MWRNFLFRQWNHASVGFECLLIKKNNEKGEIYSLKEIENLGKRFSSVSSPKKDNEFVCCIPSQGEYKEIRALLMNEPATV